ncbi:ATP-binding protein, partial [Verrucomicrobiota bacterium]
LEILPTLEKTERYGKYLEVLKTGKPFFTDDVVPGQQFGQRHLAIKTFKVGKGLGLICSDVTAQKKMEQDLQQALTELKDTQQQVIQDERLRALGQMARGIAHDFNNALVPILGFTDFLLQTPSTLDDKKETISTLETIRSAALQAREAIRQLQEFYRPSDGVKHEPIDLKELINGVIALTQPRWKEEMDAKGSPVQIKTDVHDILHVSGNESQLSELLTNLIFNAVDAMPDGGVITIRSYAHESDKAAVLEVSDTGTGMTEEVLRQCMEPFFTTKGGRGSGLGLSLVHGLIRRHGGTFDIESTPGQGTIFMINLPLAKHPPEKKEPVIPPPPTSKPMRILFVDDEISARDVISRYLEAENHTVETAASGKEGLKKFRKGTFDLVIADWAMPEMSGDQLAAAIKKTSPNTSVIILTGFGDLIKAEAVSPSAVDAIVTKPVTRQELREAIAEVTANKLAQG